MSTPNTVALVQFLNKIRGLQRSRSKQIVISAEEANDIAASIALVLIENTELLKQANEIAENQVIQMNVNGGSFKE